MAGQLQLRWSEHEARKPYARPFGVSFSDDGGADAGGVAVSGSALLYYREFQGAVLTYTGQLFRHPVVEEAADTQGAWLEVVGALLPPLQVHHLRAESTFDEIEGRRHHLSPGLPDRPWVVITPQQAFDYQEFQASLAHQTGALFRRMEIEAVGDPVTRQRVWLRAVADLLQPSNDAPPWPFR